MQRSFSFVLSIFCLLLILAEAAPLHAGDDAVDLKSLSVTRTRTSDTPSSITVITQKKIKEKQYTQVLNLLREEVGMEVVQSGPLGTSTSVFMRGAGSS